MDNLEKVRAELEGLSALQLGLLIELAVGWLPGEKRNLLVKLAGQMKQVNEQTKERG